MGETAVVLVHGLFSAPKTWDDLLSQFRITPQLHDYDFHRFEYWTPKFRANRLRRIPDHRVIATRLDTFLRHQCGSYERIVLIAHSQGGLIIQRYLADMLTANRAAELTKIKRIILLACPNSGSDLALLLRRGAVFWHHPQERSLQPFDDDVAAVHSLVLERVIYASSDDDSHCRIPFSVYAGESDNVVTPASALGSFPREVIGVLPGDHFSILEADHQTITALVGLLLEIAVVDPLLTPPSVRHNLVSGSVLCGREDEIRRTIAGLGSELPIVRVLGLGGIGKTALVKEVSWRLVRDTPVGVRRFDAIVWFDRAGAAPELDNLLDVIAKVLDYPYLTKLHMPDKESQVLERLAELSCLIVLDDFDGIGHEAITRFMNQVRVPQTKFLLTSRSWYDDGRSWLVRLGELDPAAVAELIEHEATRLGFPTPMHGGSVAVTEIRQATGGNPLAIRLAVGQLYSEGVPVTEIVGNLREARDSEIFAAIFGNILSDFLVTDRDARNVLRSIALHPAGVSRDAIAAGADLTGPALTSAIRRLVVRSLIDPVHYAGSIAIEYRMHMLTRTFALRDADALGNNRRTVEDRLISHYARYAHDHAETYRDAENIRRLDRERANILWFAVRAYVWADASGDRDCWRAVLQFSEDLSAFLWGRGHWRDRIKLATLAIEAADKLDQPARKSLQYAQIGRVHLRLNNVDQARACLHAGEQALPSDASELDRNPILRLRAKIAGVDGDLPGAESILCEVLAVAPDTVDDEGRAATFLELGIVATRRGDHRSARSHYESALALDERAGTVEGTALSLSHLGNALLELGETDTAGEIFARALALAERADRLSTIGRSQIGLARVRKLRGEREGAAVAAAAAVHSFTRLGMEEMVKQARLIAAEVAATDRVPIPDAAAPRAVIFDCDDTLIATRKKRWADLIRTAAEFGENLSEDTIRRHWGKPFDKLIGGIAPTLPYHEFLSAYQQTMRGNKPEPTPGAVDLLHHLRRTGTAMSIVTSSHRDLIRQDLDVLQLTSFFSAIYGFEETAHHKPDARVLAEPIGTLQAQGYALSDIVYIGDSVHDFQAATKNHLHFLAVLTGLDTREMFLAAGLRAEFIVDNLDQFTASIARDRPPR